jgi:hypothetical protein
MASAMLLKCGELLKRIKRGGEVLRVASRYACGVETGGLLSSWLSCTSIGRMALMKAMMTVELRG